jgi:hypothetical protein
MLRRERLRYARSLKVPPVEDQKSSQSGGTTTKYAFGDTITRDQAKAAVAAIHVRVQAL